MTVLRRKYAGQRLVPEQPARLGGRDRRRAWRDGDRLGLAAEGRDLSYSVPGLRRSGRALRSAFPARRRRSVGAADARIQMRARPQRTLLRDGVHLDQPEPRLPALRPLEVVEERPVEVAAHVGAAADRLVDRRDMVGEESRPDRIRCIVDAVLRHVKGHLHRGKPHELPREALDRKSTRLNSSHTVISYAVFCLKKKKKKKKKK